MGSSQPAVSRAIHSDHVEQLSQAVTREWLCDGQIVAYTVTDARRESVDAWVNAFKEDIMNWPLDRPFRVLHDLSARGAVSTPYARMRAQEVVAVRPEVKGRAALVLSGSLVNSLIHVWLNRQSEKTPRIRKTFLTREQAIAWLLDEA